MKKICELLAVLWMTILGRLSATAPAETSCHTLIPTGDLKVALDDLIDDLECSSLSGNRCSRAAFFR